MRKKTKSPSRFRLIILKFHTLNQCRMGGGYSGYHFSLALTFMKITLSGLACFIRAVLRPDKPITEKAH